MDELVQKYAYEMALEQAIVKENNRRINKMVMGYILKAMVKNGVKVVGALAFSVGTRQISNKLIGSAAEAVAKDAKELAMAGAKEDK